MSQFSIFHTLEEPLPEAILHSLPCTIHHNGEAAVEKFFLPQLSTAPKKSVKVLYHEDNSDEPSSPMKRARISEHIAAPLSIESIKDETKNFSATLRGRSLHGKYVQIPEKNSGLVFKETFEEGERKLKAIQSFAGFVYWNHDDAPSKSDPLQLCFDWLDVAEQLHKSVEDKETVLES